MKYLIVLLVVAVGVMLWLSSRRRVEKEPGDDAATRAKPSAPKPGAAGPQAMLACTRCGVHLPQADAVMDPEGRPYCGPEHRRLGPG